MINNKFKNGIEDLKKISMTSDEKNKIFQNIIKSSSVSEKSKDNSTEIYSWISIFSTKRKLVYYSIIPLVIILSGTSIVFASENILPNNILYPIKVGIIEPVEGAISFSLKAKAKHESILAEKRIIEAEKLASEDKLDLYTENKINNLISRHTSALNKAIDKIDASKKDQEIEEITTNFQAEMNAHAVILDNIKNKKMIKKYSIDLNIDSNKKNSKNINVLNDNLTNKISDTARSSANKIKEVINLKVSNNLDNYIKRKNRVEGLIDKTIDNMKIVSEENNGDSSNEKDTNKLLNDAKSYLNDANKKNDEGDRKEAYRSMLNSESKVLEANILLKTNPRSNSKIYKEKKNSR
jgi:hypothetical protein